MKTTFSLEISNSFSTSMVASDEIFSGSPEFGDESSVVPKTNKSDRDVKFSFVEDWQKNGATVESII